MRSISILLYEWKHFVRSPFKVVALVLFVMAASYGLHNGANLYHSHEAEITQIKTKTEAETQKCIAFFEEGKTGPEDRPWVDITTPIWSIRYSNIYHFKAPSPALVYSIGQAEQYGFYKAVDIWSSPYDSDMTQEITNPERLQTGTLDFAFTLVFLLPLLLLIFLYNLKSLETEQGFLPLIAVQASTTNRWVLSRFLFYVGLVWFTTVFLLLYGSMLTPVFSAVPNAFTAMLGSTSLYLLFWSVIYFLILRSGSSILSNALKMVGVWLLLAFVIPATVHQWISIEKPADFMTEYIDAERDQVYKLYDLPDSVQASKLRALFPEIAESPVAQDSNRSAGAYRISMPSLANELRKQSMVSIEAGSAAKNALVNASFPLNPIAFFQNHFNRISHAHYDDYQQYRNEIQALVEKQINTLVKDTWNDVTVDKKRFQEYQQILAEP